MIPKTIHQIWVGNKEIPKEFVQFSNMWKEMYPEFEYVLWDDNKVRNTNIIKGDKLDYYNDGSYPIAFKADILRYEIIKEYGGIYIDMDTEPLKRMGDDIFNLLFFAGIQNNGEVNNSLFGAEKENELIKNVNNYVVQNIESSLKNKVTKNEVHILTGPPFFTDVCKHFFNTDGYKFFDSVYFYPYWFLDKHRRDENFKETSPDAFSVHHWLHSWGPS